LISRAESLLIDQCRNLLAGLRIYQFRFDTDFLRAVRALHRFIGTPEGRHSAVEIHRTRRCRSPDTDGPGISNTGNASPTAFLEYISEVVGSRVRSLLLRCTVLFDVLSKSVPHQICTEIRIGVCFEGRHAFSVRPVATALVVSRRTECNPHLHRNLFHTPNCRSSDVS
jgi:hypothetical protein